MLFGLLRDLELDGVRVRLDEFWASVYISRAGWRVPCVFITLAGFGQPPAFSARSFSTLMLPATPVIGTRMSGLRVAGLAAAPVGFAHEAFEEGLEGRLVLVGEGEVVVGDFGGESGVGRGFFGAVEDLPAVG